VHPRPPVFAGCEADAIAAFSSSLASLGDIYCCDAFGTAHRAHASMVLDLPVKVAGTLVLKELQAFSGVLTNPQKPVMYFYLVATQVRYLWCS
jgi:phosphoglycerate kinase